MTPPASVTLIGGDVHHAYVAEVSLGKRDPRRSRVHQVVCSPFRNPLTPGERRVVKLTRNPVVAGALRWLAGLAGVKRPSVDWRFRAGPTFDNSLGIVELDGRWAGVTIYRAEPGEEADALVALHTRVLADGPRAEPAASA